MKIIRDPNSSLSSSRKKALEREIDLQHGLNHPNCLKLIGVSNVDGCTVLILPWCEYSLNDLIHFPNKERKEILRKMTYQTKVRILLEIAEGIQYLHTNQRIHRDIKVPNYELFGSYPACQYYDAKWSSYDSGFWFITGMEQ